MTAPVPVRDASTVVLLRDGAQGLEVWLLTRVTQMVFAAGMSVFPGGRVDAADADLPFAGPVEGLAARLGCDEGTARMLVGGAVRETFEETGVLLATPPVDLTGARADVEAGRVSFGELLGANGAAIDPDVLHPWSRWVTPEGEVRRYDTRFFIGALPPGAEAHDVTSESSTAGWVGIQNALDQAQRGERGMLPPTLATLASLAAHATVAEVVAAAPARPVEAIRPEITVTDDGRVVAVMPDGSSVEIPKAMLR